MLFRMGQCLSVPFDKDREAEGDYRGSEEANRDRRSIEKDYHRARPLVASRTPGATWRAVLTTRSSTAGLSPVPV